MRPSRKRLFWRARSCSQVPHPRTQADHREAARHELRADAEGAPGADVDRRLGPFGGEEAQDAPPRPLEASSRRGSARRPRRSGCPGREPDVGRAVEELGAAGDAALRASRRCCWGWTTSGSGAAHSLTSSQATGVRPVASRMASGGTRAGGHRGHDVLRPVSDSRARVHSVQVPPRPSGQSASCRKRWRITRSTVIGPLKVECRPSGRLRRDRGQGAEAPRDRLGMSRPCGRLVVGRNPGRSSHTPKMAQVEQLTRPRTPAQLREGTVTIRVLLDRGAQQLRAELVGRQSAHLAAPQKCS